MNSVAAVPAVGPPLLLNSPQEITIHISLGQLRWAAPLLFLPARTVFSFLAQSLFAAIYRSQGHASPWKAAGNWWTVWGTLVDVACLACLFFLTRRENLRIRDLLGPIPRWLVPKGIACLLLVFPSFMVAEPVARCIAYHSWHAPIPHLELLSRHLPVWAMLYSLLIWWPIWSVTEELTYNGYLASRFAALSHHRWVAYSLVGFWWALQHSFLPFTFEWRFLLYKLFMFLPCALILIAIYLRTRKLAPLILAHWMMDLSAVFMTLSF
jgi:CAAX prenyl protease-like protein